LHDVYQKRDVEICYDVRQTPFTHIFLIKPGLVLLETESEILLMSYNISSMMNLPINVFINALKKHEGNWINYSKV